MRPTVLRRSTAVAALIPLGLAAFVNFPVTRNYFWGDDFYHFYRMRNLPLLEFLLQSQGGHLQATPFGVYYALSRVAGMWAAPYFWSALATHLLNVALLFVVIRRVTASDRLACFGAALWGTSPVLEESISWYAAYGNVLLGTWLLWLLLELTSAERSGRVTRGACVRLVVLLFLAATSFGTGIGVVLVAPVAASLFLRDSPARPVIVKLCWLVAIALPLLYVALNVVFKPHEGPMIAPPVPILALVGHLMGYGIARTSLGTLWPAHEFPGALGAIAIVLFAGAVLALGRWGSSRTKRHVLAYLFLALGGYFMIALGRAAFYTLDPALVGNADRYQYIGPLAITLCWCVMLCELGQRVRVASGWKTALLLGSVAAILWGHLALPRASLPQFAWSRQETTQVLGTIEAQIMRVPRGEDVFILNQPFFPLGPMYATAQDLFPGWAGLFVVFFPENVVAGRRVHFVVSDQRVLEAAQHGRRSVTLLVPPGAVPPGKLADLTTGEAIRSSAAADVAGAQALAAACRKAVQLLGRLLDAPSSRTPRPTTR